MQKGGGREEKDYRLERYQERSVKSVEVYYSRGLVAFILLKKGHKSLTRPTGFKGNEGLSSDSS